METVSQSVSLVSWNILLRLILVEDYKSDDNDDNDNDDEDFNVKL
jgi:hypothetical protein